MSVTTSEQSAAAPAGRPDEAPLLAVDDLRTHFFTRRGVVKAVDGVSFAVAAGETLAIVGESGCGKSVTALSLMRLVPDPPGRIVGGTVKLGEVDLLALDEEAMRDVRGKDVAMIFQEPMTSLNPVMRIGDQITEAVRLHQAMTRKQAWEKAVEMLRLVRIPDPARRAQDYPHQLSGGMRQRVMIAMAVSCNPKLLIADEPTTALDVTIQAQILDLMRELQETLGTAIVLITHDMGIVAENADRVVVMYAGRKVEEASAKDLFECPGHPYTKGLLGSIPNVEVAAHTRTRRARLNEIKGMVPSLSNLPKGCTYAPRCGLASEECRASYPPLSQYRPGHWVACWHAEQVLEGGK